MNSKIKVAYLIKNMKVNGITIAVMNYCRYLDKEEFQITIISGSPITDNYRSRCQKEGIEIIETPLKQENPIKYYRALWRILAKERFDIVHVHGNSAVIAPELLIAKVKGIKVRIAHSHNTTCTHPYIHKILSPIFAKTYTAGFACGELAGKWMYGKKKFDIIPNGFETQKFIFSEEKRKKIREELALTDQYVIGHVGNFTDQKNYPFLLKVFSEVALKRSDAWLLLVGEGEGFDEINKLIKAHPYRDRIICYGATEQVEYVYATMDAFVLPSRHEGLCFVLLEAQMAGLPCITSDVVTREVELGGEVTFLPLANNYDEWRDVILEQKQTERAEFYLKNEKSIKQYDIKTNAKWLGGLYTSFMKR